MQCKSPAASHIFSVPKRRRQGQTPDTDRDTVPCWRLNDRQPNLGRPKHCVVSGTTSTLITLLMHACTSTHWALRDETARVGGVSSNYGERPGVRQGPKKHIPECHLHQSQNHITTSVKSQKR